MLKYPIGKFEKPVEITPEILEKWIGEIEEFPIKLQAEIDGLNEEQLDTVYRPGGWTLRQVVHHCADSHLNAFMRLKLTLTEDIPTIKPYEEALWAELPDGKLISPSVSIGILTGIHIRWVYLVRSISKENFNRKYIHPADGQSVSLQEFLGMYAWHGNHHLAHIQNLKKRMNW